MAGGVGEKPGLLGAILALALAAAMLAMPAAAKEEPFDYYRMVVRTAIDRMDDVYGPHPHKGRVEMTRDRAVAELEKGELQDYLILPVRGDYHEKFIPVPVPVAKGILGYRVFLIDRAQQDRFRGITSLDQLKALRLGAGSSWGITRVFQANGFNVVTGDKYDGLFGMLLNDRFDYFPRGVNEVLEEYRQRKDSMPALAIEDSILLYTPLPLFVYVTPGRPDLAKRIEEGFARIRADGTFDRMFQKEHGALIEALNLKGRKVFRIPNPDIEGLVPLDRKDLWFTLD